MKEKLFNTISDITIIAGLTLREALRKRMIFIVVIVSGFFLFVNLVCEMSVRQNNEDVANTAVGSTFLFMMASFWNLAISGLVTSSLISDEFENKTHALILSKPVFRLSYLFGKFFGVILLILVNCLFLIASYSAITYFKYGIIDWDLWKSFLSMQPAFALLISFVILITINMNRSSAVLLTFALVFVTCIINFPVYEENVFKAFESSDKKIILEMIYWILPQFGTILYHSMSFVAKSLAQTHYLGTYSYFQMSAWLLIAWVLLFLTFRKKELE